MRNSSALLNRYMQKSIENRLRRWDFCTPESFSHGLRSTAQTWAELLRKCYCSHSGPTLAVGLRKNVIQVWAGSFCGAKL